MVENINKFMILVLLLLVPILCGCISEKDVSIDKVRVATTISPLGDLVEAVGGDKVIVTVIVPPGAEPHTFEPTPSQVKEVAKADLYVLNGAGLEFWMDKLLQAANQEMLVVDSSKGISFIQESEDQTDPHIWTSPSNAAIQVQNIYEGLIMADPSNKDYYLKNKEDYLQKLEKLEEEFDLNFASKNSRIFIVHHPAWSYFARDFGLTQVSIMEEEKEPGPKYLGELIELAKEKNITTIFVEPEYNPKAALVIAQEMNAKIIEIDPLAKDYLENMRLVGNEIARSMT